MKFLKELIAEFSLFPQRSNVNGEMDFSVDGEAGSIMDLDSESELGADPELGVDPEQDLELGLDDNKKPNMCQCDDEEENFDGSDEFSDFESDKFYDFDDEIGNTLLSGEEDFEDDEESDFNLFSKAEETTPKEKFKFI